METSKRQVQNQFGCNYQYDLWTHCGGFYRQVIAGKSLTKMGNLKIAGAEALTTSQAAGFSKDLSL